MKFVGIAGWKNSGKTRLVLALIDIFSRQGLRVSTIKHAHHSFDVDHKGKDSFLHRGAGAFEVLIASNKRWALMHEGHNIPCGDTPQEPILEELFPKLAPVDVVLVEGFKCSAIDKLEVHRTKEQTNPKRPLLAESDARIRAIVSDAPLAHTPCPVLNTDDAEGIAAFILKQNFFQSFYKAS